MTICEIKNLALVAAFGMLAACGQKYDISTDENDPAQDPINSNNVGHCDLHAIQANLKIFLMVDNSGSTKGTDPQHKTRVETVQTFLTSYSSKSNFTYGFGYFYSKPVVYDGDSGKFVTNPNSYFVSADKEKLALDILGSSKTSDGTAYGNALSKVKDLITADHASDKSGSRYAVVFMSDGQPTDLGDGDVTGKIRSLVDGIVQIDPAAVTVSSVYFGPKDDDKSISNLQAAADAGNGIFLNTNDGSKFTIDSLVATRVVCK